LPPAATGVAECSAALVDALRDDHELDVFVHHGVESETPRLANRPARHRPARVRPAHDFVWLHRQTPYDLIVYQLGNSSNHDYEWPYLFRFPGLTVLHDAHLHHARAALLLRSRRTDDYRLEFAWNHPDSSPAFAELAVAGFDNHLHYLSPMTRLVTRASRMVAVHSAAVAEQLRKDIPDARIEAIRLGHGRALSPAEGAELRRSARSRYGIPEDALVFGCYGGLTLDKRLPQVLAAFAATRAYAPSAQLLLAGGITAHYDLQADVDRHGLRECTTITGYLPTEEEFTASIAACDVALNLRWPTAREMSGPWLRCLAAAKPTVIIDLAHLAGVPSLDPRTWQPNAVCRSASEEHSTAPIAVAIDIVDEDHSLRAAMRRLAIDPAFRSSLGSAAQQYWSLNHSIDAMLRDYRRLIAEALRVPDRPRQTSATGGGRAVLPDLPPHLVDDGARVLREIVRPFGVREPLGLDYSG
jgi:glycosyltransferase involved in cell wall biosynthesis